MRRLDPFFFPQISENGRFPWGDPVSGKVKIYLPLDCARCQERVRIGVVHSRAFHGAGFGSRRGGSGKMS